MADDLRVITFTMVTENNIGSAKEAHYASIGYLFYSIAASDGHVLPPEASYLRTMIKRAWLALDDSWDDLGTDTAYYIEFAFDLACEEKMKANEAFERFRKYYEEAPERFTRTERQLILDTAGVIASAVGRWNKSELIVMSRVAELFGKDRSAA